MASVLLTTGGVVVNALAFSSTNFVFSRLTDHGAEEQRHDLALKKLQRARDEWNRDRMKRLDFMNKRLSEKMKREHISTMLMKQCYRVFAKKVKPLPPEPELSDFYHPSETQKNGELLFVALGRGVATYAMYKYLK